MDHRGGTLGRREQRWLLREVVKRITNKLGAAADNSAYNFTEPGVGFRMPGGGE